jgi:alpha-tubulin suppressor-like RCC1 family protein
MPRNPGGTVSGFKLLSTPDAPTITGVTTSLGSASVAFTAPSDTGDGAITSYVVTAVDESSGASTGGTGASSPITVSPPAGGTFKIRMQALNPYGPGRLTEYDTGNVIYGGAELYAWGRNNTGQIGDNTGINRSSPVQIGALTTWSSLDAGRYHNQAIKTDGTMWAWGVNSAGQLGIGTIVWTSSPVQIGLLTNWYQVSAGRQESAATRTDGTLWSWGSNNFGQLGINQASGYRSSPVQIGALTDWYQVWVGYRNMVSVKTNGTLWSWGQNQYGQIGDNTTTYRSSPVQVGGLTNWSSSSVGRFFVVAVKTDGTLWSWGVNNNGALGQNILGTVRRSSPVQIGALQSWSKVSVGYSNVLAIQTNNTIWAWGENDYGMLGLNNTVNRSSPVQIGALTNWANVSAYRYNGSAIKTNGTLWTWGRDNHGQLGNNTNLGFTGKSSPIQIGALTDWLSVSFGKQHAIALYGVV